MSRELEVATIMRADATLMAILTGGVYTDQEVGVEGIRREEGSPTENAFDSDGFLKPCALIREGSTNPIGDVRNVADKFVAVSQNLFITFYEMRGHDQIDLAKLRTQFLLEGTRLGRSYPVWMESESPPIPDSGPIMFSTTLLQVWTVVSTRILA